MSKNLQRSAWTNKNGQFHQCFITHVPLWVSDCGSEVTWPWLHHPWSLPLSLPRSLFIAKGKASVSYASHVDTLYVFHTLLFSLLATDTLNTGTLKNTCMLSEIMCIYLPCVFLCVTKATMWIVLMTLSGYPSAFSLSFGPEFLCWCSDVIASVSAGDRSHLKCSPCW